MTLAKVKQIADTNGKRDVFSTGGGYSFQVRSYRTCAPYSVVTVGFDKRGRNLEGLEQVRRLGLTFPGGSRSTR